MHQPPGVTDDRRWSRRSFLRRVSYSHALLTGALGLRSTITLSAEPVSTTVAVLQLAMAVGRLMGRSGPSLTDLLRLQTQMLQTVSKQITVVEQKVDAVAKHVAEIAELMRLQPVANARELLTTHINGSVGLYNEMLEIHARTLAQGRLVTEALSASSKQRDRILIWLPQARSSLMSQGRNGYAHAAAMAAALHAEVTCLTFEGATSDALDVTANRYRDWFQQAEAYFAAEADTIRKRRVSLLSQLSEAKGLFACYDPSKKRLETKRERVVVRGGGPDHDGESYEIDVHCNSVNGEVRHFVYTSTPTDIRNLRTELEELLAANVARPDDVPLRAMFQLKGVDKLYAASCARDVQTTHPDIVESTPTAIREFYRIRSRCDNASPDDDYYAPWAVELSKALTATAYPLLNVLASGALCRDSIEQIGRYKQQFADIAKARV